jgi:LysM repeat protein
MNVDKAIKDIVSLTRSTQSAFDAIGPEIGNLKKQLTNLQSLTSDLQLKMFSKSDALEPAVVSPTEKGYGVSHNQYGAFPVIVEDAQSYLDGYKLRLRIGNTTAATMTGVSLVITYGLREPAFPSDYKKLSETEKQKAFQEYDEKLRESEKSRRTLSVDADRDFMSGSWNTVDVMISPAKPEELGRLAVMVNATGMKLSQPTAPYRSPVVVGPGEYVVKPGDTGTKISKATGASLADLEGANPGLDWRRLRVGQIIQVPPKPPVTELPDQQPAPSSPK